MSRSGPTRIAPKGGVGESADPNMSAWCRQGWHDASMNSEMDQSEDEEVEDNVRAMAIRGGAFRNSRLTSAAGQQEIQSRHSIQVSQFDAAINSNHLVD